MSRISQRYTGAWRPIQQFFPHRWCPLPMLLVLQIPSYYKGSWMYFIKNRVESLTWWYRSQSSGRGEPSGSAGSSQEEKKKKWGENSTWWTSPHTWATLGLYMGPATKSLGFICGWDVVGCWNLSLIDRRRRLEENLFVGSCSNSRQQQKKGKDENENRRLFSPFVSTHIRHPACLINKEQVWRCVGVEILIISRPVAGWMRLNPPKMIDGKYLGWVGLAQPFTNHFLCWNEFKRKRYAPGVVDTLRVWKEMTDCVPQWSTIGKKRRKKVPSNNSTRQRASSVYPFRPNMKQSFVSIFIFSFSSTTDNIPRGSR